MIYGMDDKNKNGIIFDDLLNDSDEDLYNNYSAPFEESNLTPFHLYPKTLLKKSKKCLLRSLG